MVKEIVFNHKELVSKAQVNIFGLHFRLGLQELRKRYGFLFGREEVRTGSEYI